MAVKVANSDRTLTFASTEIMSVQPFQFTPHWHIFFTVTKIQNASQRVFICHLSPTKPLSPNTGLLPRLENLKNFSSYDCADVPGRP